jgi:hypothetical protein
MRNTRKEQMISAWSLRTDITTTPVLYLYLDRLSDWSVRLRQRVIQPPRDNPARHP